MIFHEIQHQYDAIEQCVRYLDEKIDALRTFLAEISFQYVLFLGSGSSFSVAKSMADAVNMRFGRPACAVNAGDAAVHADRYKILARQALIVPISRSGQTSELLLALRALRKCSADFHILSVSCAEGSPLSKSGDFSLEMPWCFDRSVCQTRTVSCLYFSAMYLFARLSDDAVLVEQLSRFSRIGSACMKENLRRREHIAKGNWTHAVILADAELHGLAEEAALAFKEICQVQSSCFHVLDVRHGPIVLIGKDTLVIACITASTLEKDLIGDLIARQATILTCTDLPLSIEGAQNLSAGTKLDPIVCGLIMIAACQMIAFFKSAVTGTDPDHPQGLDAWIRL